MKIGRSVSSAIAAHSALTTGIHGVGGSTVQSAVDVATLIATHAALRTGIHGVILVLKAADEAVISDTTLQNDDHLFFAVAANEVWEFFMLIRATRAVGGARNLKYAFAVPAGATIKVMRSWAAVTDEYDGTAARDFTLANTIIKYNIERYLYIGGGNAGNIQFQWAQSIGAEAFNHIVKQNSFIVAHRLV